MRPLTATLLAATAQTLLWAAFFYSFPAMLLTFEAASGWSRVDLTLSFTLAVLAQAVAAPLAGRLIDRGHGAALMTVSGLLGAAALAGLTVAESLWAFRALWLAIGVAMAGCLYEPLFALLTRLTGEAARRRITAVTLVAGFASTVAFPAAAGLTDLMGWKAALLVLAGVSAAVAVPMNALALRALARDAAPPVPPGHAPAGPPPPGLLRQRSFWIMALAFPMLPTVHHALVNHLLPLLAERGVPYAAALLAVSMIGPMQVAGRLLMLSMERRMSARSLSWMAFVAVALATLCLIAGSEALLVPFVVLQGGAIGMTSILRPVLVAEVFGRARYGTVAGLLAMPYLAAAALAPVVASLLWRAGGYGLMLWVALGLAAAGAVLIAQLRR